MPRHAAYRARLLDWFAARGRDLPWRRDYAPWAVLVSEVMLQQTRMDRVAPFFTRFLERFPDPAGLARAPEEEVLKLWEGLGYYARARNLQAAARAMVREHAGRVPEDPAALRGLPGIGPYTAAAVASIAFGRDEPLADANVERVLARAFDVDDSLATARGKRRIAALAAELLPPGRAREFNQALMELGALVCSRVPRCGDCPISDLCEARRLGVVEERPVRSPRKAITPLTVCTGVLAHQGRIFVQKRPTPGVWAGLWEFPGGQVEPDETPEAAVVREFMEETEFPVRVAEPLGLVSHGYTTYRVALHCFLLTLENGRTQPVLHAADTFRWADAADLAGLAFPAGHRKLLDRLEIEGRLERLLAPS
ncbi:MAG: A/G-specific adenine glycosylase [Thermodesulfobacteriota bacterium]